MVLHLKVWKSKSLPGLLTSYFIDAGWSSPVARQAHSLKVAGSNPAPATKNPHISKIYDPSGFLSFRGFLCLALCLVATQRQVFWLMSELKIGREPKVLNNV